MRCKLRVPVETRFSQGSWHSQFCGARHGPILLFGAICGVSFYSFAALTSQVVGPMPYVAQWRLFD